MIIITIPHRHLFAGRAIRTIVFSATFKSTINILIDDLNIVWTRNAKISETELRKQTTGCLYWFGYRNTRFLGNIIHNKLAIRPVR